MNQMVFNHHLFQAVGQVCTNDSQPDVKTLVWHAWCGAETRFLLTNSSWWFIPL